MSACTFFGHRECYGLDIGALQAARETLIGKGVDIFYVGHQGGFDRMVISCLQDLKRSYPNITFSVVLAYLPTQRVEHDLYIDHSIFPEGLELCHPKFAIERRNRWMLERSDYCICYITHPWGGAYRFVHKAKARGSHIINLGDPDMVLS